jgi:hypothetical protein
MAVATHAEHTPEERLEIYDRPMPELIDGQLLERPPMGQKSDSVAADVLFILYGFVKAHPQRVARTSGPPARGRRPGTPSGRRGEGRGR